MKRPLALPSFLTRRVLIVPPALLLFVAVCSRRHCEERLFSSQSPDSVYRVDGFVDGRCGGATVGFVTDVVVSRSTPIPGVTHRANVITLRGAAQLSCRWSSSRKLEISCLSSRRDTAPLRRIERWRDLEIVYHAQTLR